MSFIDKTLYNNLQYTPLTTPTHPAPVNTTTLQKSSTTKKTIRPSVCMYVCTCVCVFSHPIFLFVCNFCQLSVSVCPGVYVSVCILSVPFSLFHVLWFCLNIRSTIDDSNPTNIHIPARTEILPIHVGSSSQPFLVVRLNS